MISPIQANVNISKNNALPFPKCKSQSSISCDNSNILTKTLDCQGNINRGLVSFKALTPREKQLLFIESGLKEYLNNIPKGSHLKPQKVDEILTRFVGEQNVDRTKPFFVSPRSIAKGVTKGRVIFYKLPETQKVVVLETHRVPNGSTTRLFDFEECIDGEYKSIPRNWRSYMYKVCGNYGFSEANYFSKVTHINSGANGKKWVDTFPDDLTKVNMNKA